MIIGSAYIQSDNGEIRRRVYEKYQRNIRTLRAAAEELCQSADVNISELSGGCSFDEVKKFQRVLPEYQIVIYGSGSIQPLYTDNRYTGKTTLNIMFHNKHYLAMRSVKACFGARYICPQCHTHSTLKSSHACKYSCRQCLATPKCDSTSKALATCTACYRNFYGYDCYMKHLLPQVGSKITCEIKKNCGSCKAPLEKDHSCGKRRCFTCDKIVNNDNHLCHMPKYTTKRKDDEKYLYVMFDLETQQNTPLSISEPKKFKHIPNLNVSQSVCTTCLDISDISVPCTTCGVRENIYYSKKCVADFMDFLVVKHKERENRVVNGKNRKVSKFDKIIVIAHNMSGFDGQFILKYIYESDRFKSPGLIMNGTKIIEITLDSRIKFVDSFNYFQKGLSELPELCGFEGSKGHYPHFWNTPENENYVGPLPKKQFYGYDSMSAEGRVAFDKWYDSHEPDYVII